MVLQVSTALRNAMLEQIENIGNGLAVVAGVGGVTGTPSAPTLSIYAGTVPATPATADGSTALAVLALPTAFMAAASGGSIALSGTWQDASADLTGTAGHFRMKTGATVFAQGSCGQQVVLSTTGATAIGSNVLPMTTTTGIVVGMNITGTNVPPAATVLSISAGVSVTMSIAATAIIASATSCTFTPDLTIDNASITAGQQVTVTAFSVATQNG
jgi:hypothetical protein